MPTSISHQPASRQPASADRTEIDGSAVADLDLEVWRMALKNADWTIDALAVHWAVDRGYAWKVMNGEKPLSRDRALTFPADVQVAYFSLKAQACGLLVIAPLAHEQALHSLAAGLISLLSRLNVRAADSNITMRPERRAERRSA